jgi:hypothetical protein
VLIVIGIEPICVVLRILTNSARLGHMKVCYFYFAPNLKHDIIDVWKNLSAFFAQKTQHITMSS